MILGFNVALLMVISFPREVYVKDLSVKEANSVIEFYNNCTCVSENRCDENNNIITYDPSLVIERRMNTDAKRIMCQSKSPSVKQYCCKQLDQGSDSDKPQNKTPETQNAILEVFNNCKCVPENRCNDNHNAESDPSVFIQRRTSASTNRIRCQSDSSIELYCCKELRLRPIDRSPENVKCGTGISSLIPRIWTKTDDEAPGEGEFPWMVAIFNKTSSSNYEFRCGGSLIHPKVVLTANHCVHRKTASDFTVGANGKIQLPNKDEERRRVSEIVKHPRYTHFGRLYNDAALLILEEPFPIGESINTLCLPPSGLDLKSTMCYVAGWGDDLTGQRSQHMKKVQLPFIDRSQCQTLLRKTRLGSRFSLHDSFLCAGGEEGKDACVGDGGSPLMCEMSSEEERYFQAGIVSWGIGCGKKDVPGVYTDVLKVTEWIKSVLQERNLEI